MPSFKLASPHRNEMQTIIGEIGQSMFYCRLDSVQLPSSNSIISSRLYHPALFDHLANHCSTA
jgi:hypothetical protein